MQFGDYRLEIIPDTEFHLDGGAMFGVVPRVLWSKVCPPDEDNRIRMNMNCVFIDTGRERILIETGTYLGDMVYAMRKSFSKILSFELDQSLYEQARRRFAADRHIEIIHGDSGQLLPQYLTNINERCLFWLDGHYSGGITARGELDTPIKRELEHIFAHAISDHVILIDDARCFTGQNDYPTLDELRELVSERTQGWQFSVEDDVVRIHPDN